MRFTTLLITAICVLSACSNVTVLRSNDLDIVSSAKGKDVEYAESTECKPIKRAKVLSSDDLTVTMSNGDVLNRGSICFIDQMEIVSNPFSYIGPIIFFPITAVIVAAAVNENGVCVLSSTCHRVKK